MPDPVIGLCYAENSVLGVGGLLWSVGLVMSRLHKSFLGVAGWRFV